MPPLPTVLGITEDDYEGMQEIAYPEDSAAAWETKMTKTRLPHTFVEGFAQTTAAVRDGDDPVSSGSSG